VIEQFKELLEKHSKVTILTHRNADADTLGTALGIYELLKNEGKHVEVCNPDKNLPIHLDFLPHFARIKNQMNFDKGLVISCDAGSIDLLEFDVSSRDIINIDHHESNNNFGILNIVDVLAVSSSQVAYGFLKNTFTITKNSATCFYVGMVTDTQNFTTLNVTDKTFEVASKLLSFGVDLAKVNRNLTQRKSLASLRILASALDTLELCEDAQLSSMVVTKESMLAAGANTLDLLGIIDHGISLATVRIALIVMVFEDKLKVSIRSHAVDVSKLAIHFGGGGHKLAAGFSVEIQDVNMLLEQIKKEIKKRGLLDEL